MFKLAYINIKTFLIIFLNVFKISIKKLKKFNFLKNLFFNCEVKIILNIIYFEIEYYKI